MCFCREPLVEVSAYLPLCGSSARWLLVSLHLVPLRCSSLLSLALSPEALNEIVAERCAGLVGHALSLPLQELLRALRPHVVHVAAVIPD